MSKIAFVSGVGKTTGIGFEIVKGLLANKDYQVIFNARDEKVGKEILSLLEKDAKGKPHLFLGDLVKEETIAALKKLVNDKFDGKLDVIVNNAGILGSAIQQSVFDATEDEIINTYKINTLVPLRLAKEFVPLMKKHKYGRIVNVSSGMGQLSEMSGTNAPYRFSKVGMNALTKILDSELKDENILVNSVCPGFVQTEFSAFNVHAQLTPVQGASKIIALALVGDDGPRGRFFRGENELPW